MRIKSFKQFLNEFEIEGEHQRKPLWNGTDYLDSDGDIMLGEGGLTELPCIFPEKWDGSFYCGNNSLTSLEGVPKEIRDNFSCVNNELTSLEGGPIVVGGNFYCYGNLGEFTEEDVRKVCKVKYGIHT